MTIDLIEFIRLALFIFIAISLVILATNPTKEEVEDFQNWIDSFDKKTRERRDKDGLPSRDDD